MHFGFVEDKRKADVISLSLAGGEAARDLGELGNEELDACW